MYNAYNYKFNKLSRHLKDKYKVDVLLRFGIEDVWLPNINKIFINKNKSWKIRFYSLLHESGHVIIDINNKKSKIFSEYKEKIKSKKDFISLLEEEISAWKEGSKLCEELKLAVNNNFLQKFIAECITSYVSLGLKSIYGKNINLDYISSRLI